MIYARQPHETEERELQRLIHEETGRVNTRARIILLSAQHYSTSTLEEIFAIDRVTIRRWIHRFNELGPTGLYDAPRSGRPRKQRRQDSDSRPPLGVIATWHPGTRPTVRRLRATMIRRHPRPV